MEHTVKKNISATYLSKPIACFPENNTTHTHTQQGKDLINVTVEFMLRSKLNMP